MYCNYEDGDLYNAKKVIITEKEMNAQNEEGEYAFDESYTTKEGKEN
jgi:hypothetical protein